MIFSWKNATKVYPGSRAGKPVNGSAGCQSRNPAGRVPRHLPGAPVRVKPPCLNLNCRHHAAHIRTRAVSGHRLVDPDGTGAVPSKSAPHRPPIFQFPSLLPSLTACGERELTSIFDPGRGSGPARERGPAICCARSTWGQILAPIIRTALRRPAAARGQIAPRPVPPARTPVLQTRPPATWTIKTDKRDHGVVETDACEHGNHDRAGDAFHATDPLRTHSASVAAGRLTPFLQPESGAVLNEGVTPPPRHSGDLEPSGFFLKKQPPRNQGTPRIPKHPGPDSRPGM